MTAKKQKSSPFIKRYSGRLDKVSDDWSLEMKQAIYKAILAEALYKNKTKTKKTKEKNHEWLKKEFIPLIGDKAFKEEAKKSKSFKPDSDSKYINLKPGKSFSELFYVPNPGRPSREVRRKLRRVAKNKTANKFPKEILPTVLRDHFQNKAEATGISFDTFAALSIPFNAVMIGNGATFKYRYYRPAFGALFTAVFGDSGSGKNLVFETFTEVIHDFMYECQQEAAKYNKGINRQIGGKKRSQNGKGKTEKEKSELDKKIAELSAKLMPTFMCIHNDITIEPWMKWMNKANGSGSIISPDAFKSYNTIKGAQYSNNDNTSVLCDGFSAGVMSYCRSQSDVPIKVRKPCPNIVIGLQKNYIVIFINDDHIRNGFLGRFIYCELHDRIRKKTFTPCDKKTQDTFTEFSRKVLALHKEGINGRTLKYSLTDEAEEYAWNLEGEQAEQAKKFKENGQHLFAICTSRRLELALRVSLNLCIMHDIADNGEITTREITKDHLEMGVKYMNYSFISMTNLVNKSQNKKRSLKSTILESVKTSKAYQKKCIDEKVPSGNLYTGNIFSATHIYQNLSSLKNHKGEKPSVDEIQSILDEMVSEGVLAGFHLHEKRKNTYNPYKKKSRPFYKVYKGIPKTYYS